MGGPGSGRRKGVTSIRRKGDQETGFKNSRTWSKKVGKKTITYDYQGKVIKVKK